MDDIFLNIVMIVMIAVLIALAICFIVVMIAMVYHILGLDFTAKSDKKHPKWRKYLSEIIIGVLITVIAAFIVYILGLNK